MRLELSKKDLVARGGGGGGVGSGGGACLME